MAVVSKNVEVNYNNQNDIFDVRVKVSRTIRTYLPFFRVVLKKIF